MPSSVAVPSESIYVAFTFSILEITIDKSYYISYIWINIRKVYDTKNSFEAQKT